MLGEKHQRLLIVLALVGALLSVVRLTRTFVPAPDAPPSPRAAIADNMELYELSLLDGSPLRVNAFEDVESGCKEHQNDPRIVRACHMFDDAVHHASDREKIDAAAQLLRGG
jgi:hypothetical protein